MTMRIEPIAGNGVITYSMAWQWCCMAIDVQELIAQLPDPKMYWNTRAPDRACIQWLHDCGRPEWGHITAWVNFRNGTHHSGLLKLLKEEIKRYQEMKKLIE